MATKVQLAWLQTMVTPARVTMHEWGIPASVTLAQATLESDWGRSQLARRANNYFGVKALAGEDYAEFSTREVMQGRSVMELAHFAKYPSAIESFEAHAKLLATLHRYAGALAAYKEPLGNVRGFCEGLLRGGYSTDPNYPNSLMQLVNEFNLKQYDIVPPPESAGTKETA